MHLFFMLVLRSLLPHRARQFELLDIFDFVLILPSLGMLFQYMRHYS